MSAERKSALIGALVILAAALVVGSTARGAGSRKGGAPDPWTQPTLVSQQTLPTGAVVRTYSNGVKTSGDAQWQTQFSRDSTTNGTVAGAPMITATADFGTDADIPNLAAAYAANGRSVEGDAAAIGIDPSTMSDSTPTDKNYGQPGQVYASWCTTVDNDYFHYHGCIVRKGTASTDPDHYYLADKSQAAGYAKSGSHESLIEGTTWHSYQDYMLIVETYPTGDMTTGSCNTLSVGIGAFGASFNYSFPFCPNKIHIYFGSQNFWAQWQGCMNPEGTPGTTAVTYTRVPVGKHNIMSYKIVALTQQGGC